MKKEFVEFNYWKLLGKQFLKHRLGSFGFLIVVLFCLMGVYAPFLASNKPIVAIYKGEVYFPIFRYLFYSGFYTKYLDLFFNLMIFTLPLLILSMVFLRKKPRAWKWLFLSFFLLQFFSFFYLIFFPIKDPAWNFSLAKEKEVAFLKLRKKGEYPSWDFQLKYMTSYGKLSRILEYRQLKSRNKLVLQYAGKYIKEKKEKWQKEKELELKEKMLGEGVPLSKIPKEKELKEKVLKNTPKSVLEKLSFIPTLWQIKKEREKRQSRQDRKLIKEYSLGKGVEREVFERAKAEIDYIEAKNKWLKKGNEEISFLLMPLIRPFHWEEDAGGGKLMNQFLPWWQVTRINHKDLVAALIFGVRISIVVGILAVALALLIGIPIGCFSGYYGGAVDIIVCRLMEIWESMPTFFMLLFVIAMTESKSIFIVIAVVGIFGWTGFSRYIRGEFFKQRNQPYVEACRSLGFKDSYIMFSHILPNAIPPVLTLLPFAVLAAVTSEAGLSFLGLGEEQSCSWGILMDEGRSAFPGQSYLLWPPAVMLTLLLVSIALAGDALRDALDPKMRH